MENNLKVAKAFNGKEHDGVSMTMSNVEINNENKFNESVDAYTERLSKHYNSVEETINNTISNIDTLEIVPIYNYILVKPFEKNPFQKISVSDSGLITDMGGIAPQFKNSDTGNIDEEENFIGVGNVLEVGKECKYIKEGDTIMWTKPSEVPVPFFKQGLVLVNEQRVIVVINEGLKKRFE